MVESPATYQVDDVTPAATASEVLYDVAMRRLDEQIQRVDSLDTKTAQLFSLASVVLPVLAGLLTVAGDLRLITKLLFVLAALCYGALVLTTFRGYRVQAFSLRPRPDRLLETCLAGDDAAAREWVARQAIRSIEQNEPRLGVKAFYVQASTATFAAVSLLLTLAALSLFL